MLRTFVFYLGGSWRRHLPLIKFMYNKSYQSSIGMAPYEALYWRACRSPLGWGEMGEHRLLGPEFMQDTSEKVSTIRQWLLIAQRQQKKYTDHRHKVLQFQEGSPVFLRVDSRKGLQKSHELGNLAPRYIRPFWIQKSIKPVAYRLALPPQLAGMHNVFCVSMLRKCEMNPNALEPDPS